MDEIKSSYNQGIVAIIPCYVDMKGDATKILTDKKGEHYEFKNIKRVLAALARKELLDLRECKKYYGDKLGCKNLVPIPLNSDTILIPVKTRKALTKNDSAFSYINLKYIEEVLDDKRNGIIILKDKREILTKQRTATIEKHIRHGRLVENILDIENSKKVSETELFEEYNAAVTKGDIMALRKDIMYIKSMLNT